MENFPNYSGYGQTPTVCANHPDRVSYARCGRCNRAICGECQMNQGAGTVCPDCYRDLTGGSSKARGSKAQGSFLARHWHITYTLILINVVMYGLQQLIPNEWMIRHGSFWWPYVQHGEYYRIISYGFLHMQHDPMHLVWNMIYLFIFGVSLERMMGRWKFLVVYLGSIAFGALGVYVLAPSTSVAGASGGVYGLYGAFFVILLLREAKGHGAPLYAAYRHWCGAELLQPEYFPRMPRGWFYRWCAADSAVRPVCKEARIFGTATAEPAAMATRRVLSLKIRGKSSDNPAQKSLEGQWRTFPTT